MEPPRSNTYHYWIVLSCDRPFGLTVYESRDDDGRDLERLDLGLNPDGNTCVRVCFCWQRRRRRRTLSYAVNASEAPTLHCNIFKGENQPVEAVPGSSLACPRALLFLFVPLIPWLGRGSPISNFPDLTRLRVNFDRQEEAGIGALCR
jgi:hypothetical protein